MLNRKAIATVLTIAAAALVLAQTGVFRYEARMTNGVASGKAKYKYSNRPRRQIEEEVAYEGQNLAPNTVYDLTLGGTVVGQATTDGLGNFNFDQRNVGLRHWNATEGTPVTIENANGIALSGTLALRP